MDTPVGAAGGVPSSNDDKEDSSGDGVEHSANSSSTGTACAASAIVTMANCSYKYPYNYFELKEGTILNSENDLRQRWEYRKSRQESGSGLIDVVGFDREAMIDEMKVVRNSLRDFAQLKYMEYIRPLLKLNGFVRKDGQGCVLMDDVCSLVKNKTDVTMEKSDALFEIFHFKTNNWTSDTVDAWAQENRIWLEIPESVESLTRQRNNNFYRGCFGPIVKSARMISVKKIMRNMWNGLGWKLAISKNQSDDRTNIYTSKTWGGDRTHKYYIVEKGVASWESAVVEVCFMFVL